MPPLSRPQARPPEPGKVVSLPVARVAPAPVCYPSFRRTAHAAQGLVREYGPDQASNMLLDLVEVLRAGGDPLAFADRFRCVRPGGSAKGE